MFDNKSILITGGTGSFGESLTKKLINNYKPRRVIIYSRDELKQFELSKQLKSFNAKSLGFLIGAF